jgi:hypothetical protein
MQKIFMSSFYNFQGQAFVPSMSKVGTKVLTKVMSAQARAPGIGVSSRLFGSSQVGTRSGLLNRAGSAFKAGWGHQAVNQGKKGYVVFRYGFLKKPASNVSKYHITMGRAWRKW